MEQHEIAEIQNLPVAELTEKLAGLGVDALRQLRKLEAGADGRARKGALEAIDAAIAAAGPDAPAPAPAPKDDILAWQAPEYAGPLDIEQSSWRRANIKPVRASTK